jgi:hypothetical protein
MMDRTQKIWKAFCGELTQEPTDDMREALSTVIREIAEPLYGDGSFRNEVKQERFQIADELNDLADELEELE